MITHLDHAAFVVSDIEAMTAFYRDVCGLVVQRGRELHNDFVARVLGHENAHVKVVMLGAEGDDVLLELIEYVYPKGRDGHTPTNALGASHVSFMVDDLDATYERMSKAGMRFVATPTAEVRASGQVHSVCYAQDPEGNWIEFDALSSR
jgi:catechol 2,3-dioxygenase-like lactoylglutathione lyase family enzyme